MGREVPFNATFSSSIFLEQAVLYRRYKVCVLGGGGGGGGGEEA